MASRTLNDGSVIQDDNPSGPGYTPEGVNKYVDGSSPDQPHGPVDPYSAEGRKAVEDQAAQAARSAAKQNAPAIAPGTDAAAAAAAAARAYEARFQYGGNAGGADSAASRYQGYADSAQGRAAPQIDYGVANDDHNLNILSRGNQMSMAGLMAARARGEVPSIAQMQANRQMGQAAAEQSSAAASARGPAALALAQQGAAANTANMQSQISNSAQINAANERLQAEQAAFGAYTGVRGGDQALQGQDALQATNQGQLNLASRTANDQYQLGMTQAEIEVRKAQLAAQGNKVGIETGAAQAAAARAQAAGQHDDDRTDKYILGAAGAAAGVGGVLLSSVLGGGSGGGPQNGGGTTTGDPGAGGYNGNAVADGSLAPGTSGGEYGGGTYSSNPDPDARANGGPVQANRPYLVGERGPEIVVPTQAGHVLTAEQTRDLGAMNRPVTMARTLSRHVPGMTVSDDKAKLAAAWDQGNKAAVEAARKLASAPPEELKRVASDQSHPAHAVAAAVRETKAGAYDEGDAGAREHSDEAKAAKRDADAAWRQKFNVPEAPAFRSPVERPAAWGPAPAPVYAPSAQPAPSMWGTMAGRMRAMAYSDEKTKHRSRQGQRFGADDVSQSTESDTDSLGPSGESNRDLPDYNFIKTKSPLDVATALENDPNAISPQTEAYMRREGMWNDKTDALLKERGLRDVGTLGKQVGRADMAEFARSMRGVPYAYKPEYAEREGQAPGEVNIGPVAQEMEKSKVGATIVKPDPQGSGMRTLDQQKLVKGIGAAVADHQDQLDEMRSLMARRLGGRR